MSHRPHAKKPVLSAAALILLGSSLALSPAFAQPQPPANGGATASPTDISNQKLRQAANAIPQVEGIRQN